MPLVLRRDCYHRQQLVAGRSARLCTWLGQLSFPLYITHYPIVYAQRAWHCSHAGLPVGVQVMFFVCSVVASVLLAQACLKLYDEPVRRWLKVHWLHARPRQAQ
jgi:peptidoglycan/LPS O-acetylase OafA/YrhL